MLGGMIGGRRSVCASGPQDDPSFLANKVAQGARREQRIVVCCYRRIKHQQKPGEPPALVVAHWAVRPPCAGGAFGPLSIAARVLCQKRLVRACLWPMAQPQFR